MTYVCSLTLWEVKSLTQVSLGYPQAWAGPVPTPGPQDLRTAFPGFQRRRIPGPWPLLQPHGQQLRVPPSLCL